MLKLCLASGKTSFIIRSLPNKFSIMFKYIFSLIAVIFLFLIPSCQSPDKGVDAGQTILSPVASHENSTGVIHIDRAQIEVAGIRWGKLDKQGDPDGQRVFGEWVLHPEYLADVSSITSGRVIRVAIGMNQEVSAGSVIIEVESPELIDLQREFLEKKSKAAYLDQELNRLRTLQEGGATALKNLQFVESEMNSIHAALAGLKADLSLYGLSSEKINTSSLTSRHIIRAPKSGRIAQTNVSVGQWLEPGMRVCQIRDMKKVHADLFFFPGQLGDLKPGQILHVDMVDQSEKPQSIKVSSIDRRIDVEKKAIRVHCNVQGPVPNQVVEGGYISARLALPGEDQLDMLPANAVRKDGQEEFVFVLAPEQGPPDVVSFRKVMVDVVHRDNQQVAIRSGAITSDLEIVLEGAYYVDAQSKVAEFAEEE